MHDFEHFDQYELLGISRSASAEEIKRAYRQEIAKYHPDKWSKADPARQEYARKRASAITEAYSSVRDFAQRIAPAPTEPAVTANRAERLAHMYEQAQSLLAQGAAAQAVPILRQIQQADPFYRDSADLLAQAERSLKQPAKSAPGQRRSRRLVFGIIGGAGAAALVAAVYLLGGSRNDNSAATATAPIIANITPEPTLPAVGQSPTPTERRAVTPEPTAVPEPTATPEPTAVPEPPTATPEPTAVPEPPTATPEPSATPEPTAVPEPPTATPRPAPPNDLSGPIVLADSMDGGTWAVGSGANWTLGFENGRYRMTMKAGVGALWSYGAALPGQNAAVSADVDVQAGSAGLLFGFSDPNNYYRYVVSGNGTWALEQRTGGRLVTLLAGGGLGAGRLSVTQRGAATTLYWNNAYVAETALAGFPAGSYGFVLSGPAAADAAFDNLQVRQLP